MEIKSKLLLAALLAALTHFSAHAQSITVGFSAGIGQRDLQVLGGSYVPDGNYVKVGYFANGFDVAANANNIMALAGAWNELGYTNVSTIFGQPGRFSGQESTTDPSFDGKKICLWITQTMNNGAPTASFDNLTAYGIFSSSVASWIFPQGSSIPPGNLTSVNSSEVDQAYYGAFNGSHLMLNPVPEPSTYALLALGIAPVVIMKVRKARNIRRATAKS